MNNSIAEIGENDCSGLWWLPRTPENQVAGSLSFSAEDGIKLSLIGSFGDFEGMNRFEREPLILGLASGKLLTLHDCACSGHRFTTPGYLSSSYRIGLVYSGVHFTDPEQMVFTKARMQFSYLADWSLISGFETKITRTPNGGISRYEVSYTFPDATKIETGSALISLECDFSAKLDHRSEASLTQSVWIEVEPREGVSFETIERDFVYPLRNLLTLATSKPNAVTALAVYSNDSNVETRQEPIQILFRPQAHEARERNQLIPSFMLFSLRDVREEFPNLLQNWFDISEQLDSVCHLYFASLYSPKMYADNRFLNVVQALESYHRRRMLNEVLPKAEHRKRVKAIVASVCPEDKQWLEEQLQYSNEPRLKRRLVELLNRSQDLMTPMMDNHEAFARTVADTRNFLIHYDHHLKNRAASGEQLFFLTEKLSILLRSCFLLELGLTPERALELFTRNEDYKWATTRKWESGQVVLETR